MSEFSSPERFPEPEKSSPLKSTTKTGILIGVLISLLIISIGFAIIYYQQAKNLTKQSQDTQEIQETITKESQEETDENEDDTSQEEDETPTEDDTNEDNSTYFLNSPETTINFLDTLKSVKVMDIFEFKEDEFGYSPYTYQMENSQALQFGEIKGGKYHQGKLIRLDVALEGLVFQPTFVRLIQLPDNKIIVLPKYSNLNFEADHNKFDLDYNFSINELDAPQTLNLGASNKIVHFVKDTPAIFKPENKTVFYTDSDNRKIYTDKEIIPHNTSNGFYLKLVDGTQASYEYKPRFIPENRIPNFTFNATGLPNQNEYIYTSLSGCGSTDYINIVNKKELETSTIVAKTSTGSDIYAPTLNNNYLKQYYETYHPPYGEEKPSLAQFTSNYPILFFEDPFDRVAVLTSSLALPPAECGKPVIYLYPEKTSKISVRVTPKGGFTYTEPNYEQYGEGWNVISTPNSQMFEIEDKTKTIYPYLFWEGRGGIYQSPEEGFLVKRANIDKFLTEKLTYLGFNTTEITDFKEFWLPHMQKFPYYKITLMGNQVMDQLAPLEITPTPDTVIRLLMDFTGYTTPIKVKEQKLIKGPSRQGFTVTEWGGVIQ